MQPIIPGKANKAMHVSSNINISRTHSYPPLHAQNNASIGIYKGL